MNIELKAGLPTRGRVDALIVGRFEDDQGLDPTLTSLDKATEGSLDAGLVGFDAELNAVRVVAGSGVSPVLVIVGLGKREGYKAERLRQAIATATKAARDHKARRVAIAGVTLETDRTLVATVVEGATLGLYTFDEFRGKASQEEPTPKFDTLTLFLPKVSAEAKEALQEAQILVSAITWARDLVNRPGGDLTATAFGAAVREMAAPRGIKVKVLGKKDLQAQGFGALLGVNAGSTEPPAFIVAEYMGGKKGDRPYALVGKGVTFDTGGLCLKPAAGMEEMKTDMAGGATVFGAIQALADLKVPINVVGLVSSTDNMPGPGAYRPGDVLKSYSGLTIEVIDTDAEGRIVLADGLAYADRNYDPKATIDLATLTGSIIVTLGHLATGLFSNDEELSQKLVEASQRTDERIWPMPIWDDYADLVKSEIADVKNSDKRRGDAIAAAKFLEKFVGKRPWAHLDIAGPAWAEEEGPYTPKGGTGHGVKLLVDFLRHAV